MSNKNYAKIREKADAADKRRAKAFTKMLAALLPKGSLIRHEHTTSYAVVVPLSKHISIATKGNSVTLTIYDRKNTPAAFREYVMQTIIGGVYFAGVNRGTDDTTQKLVNRMKAAVEHILLTDPE